MSQEKNVDSNSALGLLDDIANTKKATKDQVEIKNIFLGTALEGNLKTSVVKPPVKTAQISNLPSQSKQFSEFEYKYSNVSIKKKSDRATLLKGYACYDCENYYKAQAQHLSDKELQEIMQKCSKHRATIVPPKTSPKGLCIDCINFHIFKISYIIRGSH